MDKRGSVYSTGEKQFQSTQSWVGGREIKCHFDKSDLNSVQKIGYICFMHMRITTKGSVKINFL